MVAVTVTVAERVVVGSRVEWHDRHDLRQGGKHDCFTSLKRQVVTGLRKRGYTVLSAGFVSKEQLRVLISKERPRALQLRQTAAGRTR